MLPANVLLGLTAGVLWGCGDFSGGMGVGATSGKARSALRIVLLSHISSLAALVVIVTLRHDAVPHGATLAWALVGGFCGGISLTCFYMALSRGAMGASAAVSGLLAAAIPALVSSVLEGAPTMFRLAGFVVAAVAIWMIAAGDKARGAASGTMLLAVIAGVGFGVYFVALRMSNSAGIFMPMAVARVASVVTNGLILLGLSARGSSEGWMLRGRAVLWAVAAGALDTGGNLMFIAATRAGRLDVAAVLASLYPASTIVLAAWLLHERMSWRQLAGIAVAGVAVVMITL